MILPIVHAVAATTLLLSHGFFLIRAAGHLRRNTSPRKIDRLALNLSQLLLVPVPLLGLPLLSRGGTAGLLHILLGCLPLGTLLVFRKKSFRRKHPMALPLVNGLLLTAAYLSGWLAYRGVIL